MKKYLTIVSCVLLTSLVWSQQKKFQLSSHILDITNGLPAAGVKVTLSKQKQDSQWVEIDQKTTDLQGRISDFLEKENNKNNNGIYKLTFYTNPYFEQQGLKTFYPFIEVVFEIESEEHFHVPITLSPFGYSTYRGS